MYECVYLTVLNGHWYFLFRVVGLLKKKKIPVLEHGTQAIVLGVGNAILIINNNHIGRRRRIPKTDGSNAAQRR